MASVSGAIRLVFLLTVAQPRASEALMVFSQLLRLFTNATMPTQSLGDALLALDTNHDGVVDSQDVASFARLQGLDSNTVMLEFMQIDTNRDGLLDKREIEDALKGESSAQDQPRARMTSQANVPSTAPRARRQASSAKETPSLAQHGAQPSMAANSETELTLMALDADHDGFVMPKDVAIFARAQGLDEYAVTREYMEMDENNDGRLDSAEIAKALAKAGADSYMTDGSSEASAQVSSSTLVGAAHSTGTLERHAASGTTRHSHLEEQAALDGSQQSQAARKNGKHSSARDPKLEAKAIGGRARNPAIGRTLSALDTNHDGVVDASEVASFAMSQGMDVAKATKDFMRMDMNGDGQLDKQEIAHELGGGKRRTADDSVLQDSSKSSTLSGRTQVSAPAVAFQESAAAPTLQRAQEKQSVSARAKREERHGKSVTSSDKPERASAANYEENALSPPQQQPQQHQSLARKWVTSENKQHASPATPATALEHGAQPPPVQLQETEAEEQEEEEAEEKEQAADAAGRLLSAFVKSESEDMPETTREDKREKGEERREQRRSKRKEKSRKARQQRRMALAAEAAEQEKQRLDVQVSMKAHTPNTEKAAKQEKGLNAKLATEASLRNEKPTSGVAFLSRSHAESEDRKPGSRTPRVESAELENNGKQQALPVAGETRSSARRAEPLQGADSVVQAPEAGVTTDLSLREEEPLEQADSDAQATEAKADTGADYEETADAGQEQKESAEDYIEGGLPDLLRKEEAWESEAQVLEQRAAELRLNASFLAKSTSRAALEAGARAARSKTLEILRSLQDLEGSARKAEVTAAALRAKAQSEAEEADDFMTAAQNVLRAAAP